MIGIGDIGVYIPATRLSNSAKAYKDDLSVEFLANKIGISAVARKEKDEFASDLCIKAFDDLRQRAPELDKDKIDFLCVCTQNGDHQLPHTSAIVHGKLALPQNCASFDISLGCSGYIYSLLVAKSFMETNNLKTGLVFTSDPYSEIIDPADKDTDLIFGDGATATLLTGASRYGIGKGAMFTDGSSHEALIKRTGDCLYMNGRGIFNFAMRHVPANISRCLEVNQAEIPEIDLFLLHQGSKYIVDNLVQKLKLPQDKAPFVIREYGNTVSSSIPILLQQFLHDEAKKKILACGFGVGLSIASTVLRREQQ